METIISPRAVPHNTLTQNLPIDHISEKKMSLFADNATKVHIQKQNKTANFTLFFTYMQNIIRNLPDRL